MGSSGQGRPGRPGAPLPESLSQPSALVPSHPEVPRGSGEGSDPTSLSPPSQASASLCPAHGEGTAPASLLFPSSTFQAQVPRAEPPRRPSRGVRPCCPGFSLQIVPLPLAVPPLSVKASLSSPPSSGPAEGPWVTGSCPQSTLCFPRAPGAVGVTHDGEEVGQDPAVAPLGGRSALRGPRRLAALLPGVWPKQLRGKKKSAGRPWRVGLVSALTLEDDGAAGCRGPALPEAGVGPRMGCPSIFPAPLGGSWRGSWCCRLGGLWEGLPSLCPVLRQPDQGPVCRASAVQGAGPPCLPPP